MSRIKNWIINKYLPTWCRDELMSENKRLEEKIKMQAAEIDRLNQYIDGMHDALKYRPHILISGRSDRQ